MEGVLLVLVLVISFGLNLATSSRFPLPWQDEVVFTDVAVNTAAGQGFISTANIRGEPSTHHLWSRNAPLFPLMLSQWTQVAGFAIPGVRSLNYVLILLCVVPRMQRISCKILGGGAIQSVVADNGDSE